MVPYPPPGFYVSQDWQEDMPICTDSYEVKEMRRQRVYETDPGSPRLNHQICLVRVVCLQNAEKREPESREVFL